MTRTRILLASDIHLCHLDWYGTKNDDQVAKFVSDVEEECRRDPADALLLLGDYSLDHWAWGIKGCWLNEGVSNTKRFVETHMSRLRSAAGEIRMIPGNHEQYGHRLWQEQTGFLRQDHLLCGGVLLVLLDTFGADLDPDHHSDGTYCGADTAYIRETMAQYPDVPVILCAHHFDPQKESEEFCELVRSESRILCLFSGHVHRSGVHYPERFGGKPVAWTGHYSYSGEKPDPLLCGRGIREVTVTDSGIESRYIVEENDYTIEEKTVHLSRTVQDEFTLRFPE